MTTRKKMFRVKPLEEQTVAKQAHFFDKLKAGLSKTQVNIFSGIGDLLPGKRMIDTVFLRDLEERLLVADLGINATTKIIDALYSATKRNKIDHHDQLRKTLSNIMYNILAPVEKPLAVPPTSSSPYVILLTGANGVGKTTTAGKLAGHFVRQDRRVMLVAADTFRAAATEQLQTWGRRLNVLVVGQHQEGDPAAVIFDALQSARANNIDVLIADTSGRLHTHTHLMDELQKIHRVIGKFDDTLVKENILVLDATTGQNALSQAKFFNDAIGIDGIILTKLDGTAKGGVIFSLALETAIPIRFVGVGEQTDDLHPFDSATFIEVLLGYNK